MRRPLCLCCLFFVILIIGIAELFPYEYEFSGMEKENGEIVLVEGKVRQKEVKNKNGQNTYIICLEQIMSPSVSDADNVRDKNSNLKKLNKAEGIICYIEDSYVPNIGSVVRVKGKLSVFERPDNPGEFNMPLYYKIKGIDLQMYDCSLVAVGENYSRLKEKLFRVKMKMAGLIDICFKEKYAGLAKAILFAMNTEIDEEIKQLYKDNGMLHVLCVSGVHISILGMGLYKLLSKIKIPGGINIGICILCMVLYGIMIGMGTSVFRAIVMFAMKLLARFLKRTYDVLTSACVGAFLILIEQPLYIYHSGFLLSFLSVIGLGSLNQIFPKKICKFVLADKIFQKFFSTLSVWIFTLPVYGRYYYEVSLSGLLLNVLLLPLVGVVLCLVICVCALGTAFVPWGQQVAMLCEGIFYVFEIFLKGAQKNGRVTYIIGYAGILKCLLFYTGIILVLYLSEKIKKRYIYLLIMFLCAGILIKMPPSLTITCLSVGQGDCSVIEYGNFVCMVDAGSSTESKISKYSIIPFLKYSKIREIDCLFLTHGDSDHINAAEELIAQSNSGVKIKRIVIADKQKITEYGNISELAKKYNVPVFEMKMGEKVVYKDLQIRCLAPSLELLKKEEASDNESSMVLLLEKENFQMLFTADVEGEGERELTNIINKIELSSSLVLKVAHHGSKNSTSENFLQAVSPRISIISCGKNNVYGHPHQETIQRLNASGSTVYVTKDCGAIRITEDGRNVKAYRRKTNNN